MSKQLKPIPKFASEDEEREFWATHSSTDYIDWSKAEVIREKGSFPNLKRSENVVEVPLPPDMIRRLEDRAKEQHIPLSLLVQRYLEEKMLQPGKAA
jgi:hypothetical protein